MSVHFFISRAGEDSECAQWIAGLLKEAGHTFTLQDFDFKTGSFVEHMQRAWESAGGLIAVLSPHYPGKDSTMRELRSAVAGKLPVILVRVAQCEPPHPIKDCIYRKRPFSRRLAHTQRPLPSQNSSFRRLRCALANKKTCPLSGSHNRRSRAIPYRPSKLFAARRAALRRARFLSRRWAPEPDRILPPPTMHCCHWALPLPPRSVPVESAQPHSPLPAEFLPAQPARFVLCN
jgi:hypothetical protein